MLKGQHARATRGGAAASQRAVACVPLVLPSCTPCARPFTAIASAPVSQPLNEPCPCCSGSHHQQSAARCDQQFTIESARRGLAVDRRQAMAMFLAGGMLSTAGLPGPAQAFTQAPPGYRILNDKLDGYSFVYPERWLAVTITGNDCFFRNPMNIDENVFVDISSPSSSEYKSVTDLGTPEQTAKQILEQYLNKEFMSTRIGIRREGQVLSATSREGKDGRTYFDVAIRMTSFASRNPYVATQGEVMKDYGIEWDRVLLTTLGVANNRLYELRMQTAQNTLDGSLPLLTAISNSFVLKTIEV